MAAQTASRTSKPTWRVGGSVAQVTAIRTDSDVLSKQKSRLLEIIKVKSLLTQNSFKLVSGSTSNYYFDMKPTTFDPEGATLISEVVFDLLKREHDVESIGGLELGAVPIIVSVCARSWSERPISGFVVRKEKKGHGTDKRIDGSFRPNSTVVLFDDVITKGGSVMQAVRAVREKGAHIKKIITIIDRQEGATENLQKEGLELISIFRTQDFRQTQYSTRFIACLAFAREFCSSQAK
jgi:orotate phosphoribosyltransferase